MSYSFSSILFRIIRRDIGLLCICLPFMSHAEGVSGTGFFISSDGYIATNNHVIEGADEISVSDVKGNNSRAVVILRDQANDLAIIKVNEKGHSVLPLRSSSVVKKGSDVFAIGFPNTSVQGRESKVTTGIISSLSGIAGEPNSFQISVPIQPGNSGGPLIDMTGAVVGITTAKLSAAAMLKKGGILPENVNYAVKSDYLLELIKTDYNVSRHVNMVSNRRVQLLVDLVGQAEKSIVFIVVTHINTDINVHSQDVVTSTPKYSRDSQAYTLYSDGKTALDLKNYSAALLNLGKAGEFGNDKAQNLMAEMYYFGLGVAKDYKEAAKWFGMSAEQGNAESQNILGTMYYNGYGVQKDDTAAVKWYRKSAEQGLVAAQYNLGDMYYRGLGVAIDYVESAKLYRKAADQGHVQSQCNLGRMYREGLGVPKDNNEAFMWLRKSAEKNNSYAQNELGVMYLHGLGDPKSNSEAAMWIRKSAEQGNYNAQNNLAEMYLYGRGVPEDIDESFKWYRKSAE